MLLVAGAENLKLFSRIQFGSTFSLLFIAQSLPRPVAPSPSRSLAQSLPRPVAPSPSRSLAQSLLLSSFFLTHLLTLFTYSPILPFQNYLPTIPPFHYIKSFLEIINGETMCNYRREIQS